MTTRGTNVAIAIAMVIAFLLPKRVDCGCPGASCNRAGRGHQICTDFEVEPIGFYAIELLAHRNVGFAYSTDAECH